jgi:hypothetical protein
MEHAFNTVDKLYDTPCCCFLVSACVYNRFENSSIKVFRGPRANAELVPKFHVALYASHAALAMVI